MSPKTAAPTCLIATPPDRNAPALTPPAPPDAAPHPSAWHPGSDGDRVQPHARDAVEALCRAGAVATLADEPRHVLVGDLRWLAGNGLVLFAAHGDRPADAHVLRFDETIVNTSGSIVFVRGSHVEGSLHLIEEADVDDTDDYRIAWQLWQEVAPLHRPLIERCYEAVERHRT